MGGTQVLSNNLDFVMGMGQFLVSKGKCGCKLGENQLGRRQVATDQQITQLSNLVSHSVTSAIYNHITIIFTQHATQIFLQKKAFTQTKAPRLHFHKLCCLYFQSAGLQAHFFKFQKQDSHSSLTAILLCRGLFCLAYIFPKIKICCLQYLEVCCC